jgi:hypothetical protein
MMDYFVPNLNVQKMKINYIFLPPPFAINIRAQHQSDINQPSGKKNNGKLILPRF